MTSHICADKVLHFLLGHLFTLLEDYAGHNLLAVFFVGNADDLYIADLGMSVDKLLYFLGIDVFSAADYHILKAAGYAVVPVGRAAGKVTRVEPSVLVDGRSGGLGHFVVTLHNVISSGHKFAYNLIVAVKACLGVNNFALDLGERTSHRVDSDLYAVVG